MIDLDIFPKSPLVRPAVKRGADMSSAALAPKRAERSVAVVNGNFPEPAAE